MSASRTLLQSVSWAKPGLVRTRAVRSLHVTARRLAWPSDPPTDPSSSPPTDTQEVFRDMMSTPKGQEFAKKFAEHPDALEAARKVMEVLADTGAMKNGRPPSFLEMVGLMRNKETSGALTNLANEMSKAGISMDKSLLKEMMEEMKQGKGH